MSKTSFSIRTLCLFIGVGLTACGGELEEGASLGDSANEVVARNGVALNGVALNGVALNGVALEGVALNGVALNGVALDGTALSGVLNGTPLVTTGFAGATMIGTLTDRSTVTIKIKKVQQAADGEIWLYWLESTSGTPLCVDPAGTWQPAIAASGFWNADGSHTASTSQFTFACRKMGAVAKCIELGYKPWKTVNGVQLANHHQACTRMIRGDYCGDGTSWTQDGNEINLWDHVTVQTYDSRCTWHSNAEWGPNGATCMVGYSRQSGASLDGTNGTNGTTSTIGVSGGGSGGGSNTSSLPSCYTGPIKGCADPSRTAFHSSQTLIANTSKYVDVFSGGVLYTYGGGGVDCPY